MKSNKPIYLVVCVIAVSMLIWFFTKGQLGQGLIYILLLACPLMHLVMMRGMHNMSGPKEKPTAKPLTDSDKDKNSCH